MIGLWRIPAVTRRSATLDFTSAGMGRSDYTQVWAGDVKLCNAVELVEGGAPELQIVVCEHCGITHCEPGGWVAPRWTGSEVVLLPAFGRLADEIEDGGQGTEYAPPDYFRLKGVPMMPADVAEQLPLARDPRALPLVTGRELVWWTQWSAPRDLLGRFPDKPVVRGDACIATSDGPVEGAIDAIAAALAECQRQGTYTLRPVGRGETTLTLYLDAAGSREWTPLLRGPHGNLLSPAPGLVAEPAISGGG